MKCISIICLLLLLFFSISLSQSANAVWCFGDSAGINFNNIISPQPISTGMDGRGTCASIADSNGDLMFYCFTPDPSTFQTGGVFLGVVYNRNHQVMLNGDSLIGDAWYNEMIIVPMPGDSNKYYIFCLGVTYNFGLYYSIVDMSLDSGRGDIIQKNVQINNLQGVDAISAVQHGNGRDWWLIFEKWNNSNNQFYTYLINSSGIQLDAIQYIGGSNNTNAGNFSFSMNGDKALFTTWTGLVEVMDFDRCSGELLNLIVIELESLVSPLKRYFGSEFSPDGSVLYVTSVDDTSYLFQYDLEASDISLSKDTLFIFTNVHEEAGKLRRGPDGKIYLSNAWNDGIHYNYPYPIDSSAYNFINMNLSVINSPDSLGTACNFQPYSFYLGGKRTYWGLPNNPDYDLGPAVGSICDTLYTSIPKLPVSVSQFQIYPNPFTTTITLHFPNQKEERAELTIFNMVGEKVEEKIIMLEDQTLNLSFLTEGIYFVRIKTTDQVFTEKIIK